MVPGFQLQSTYERKGKREKVLRQMPVASLLDTRELFDPGAIHRHCTSFDHIFVIDTNTKMVDGTNLSAAVSLACRAVWDEGSKVKHNGAAEMLFHFHQYAVFRYQGLLPGEAEKRAVVDLVRSILKDGSYRPNLRIAIVTDHDLGSHIAINARDVPLWGGDLLPINFTLLYASADGGKENALNRAMGVCDAAATEVLGWPSPGSAPKD
jgi:hypothetical protein